MKLDINNKTLRQVVEEMKILNSINDRMQFHFSGLGNGDVEVRNDK